MKNKCPCCETKDSEDIEEIYKNLPDKKHFVEGTFSLLKCNVCGFKFISPSLNEKELSKYYPKNYYSFKPNKLASMYYKLSSLGNHFDRGKLLEIGCGRGTQLEIYKKQGLKTSGIEPYGNKLTEREKWLGISRISLDKAKYPKDSFDYIIIRETLEHIPNQKQILKKCYKWLKPIGKLIITVPNTDSLWEKVFKENWYGYDVPRHLYNYNPKNISYFLKRFKFKINKIKVFDLPYMFYGSLYFCKKNKLFENVLFKILCVPLSLVVSLVGKGSLMEVECSK